MPDAVAVPSERRGAGETVPASLARLFGCFFLAGCASLVGDPTAFLARRLVERRQWLTGASFDSLRVLARIAPGLPAVNLAVAIGRRLLGVPGAAVAAIGILGAPVLLAGAVGALYLALGEPGLGAPVPAVQPFLSGLATASAGLAFAASVSGIRRIGLTFGHAAVILFMAGTLLLWHWPLVLVVVLAVPLSLAVVTARRGRENGDA
jgi:chromate transporter